MQMFRSAHQFGYIDRTLKTLVCNDEGNLTTGAKMKAQLAVAGKLLRDGTVGGLIFHPTISADMDVPSVNISKDWIRSLGK